MCISKSERKSNIEKLTKQVFSTFLSEKTKHWLQAPNMFQNNISYKYQKTKNATGKKKLLSIIIWNISNNGEARKKVPKDTFFLA